ncbi:hypothetical protein COO60DRAFT_1007977 [Scenedesmus sp. NREL 46B-D3]|nr:hypothetical protein COO60DRAFT_1007977 [Scenedesmus sp. NREL 46B-D3]
MDFTTFVATQAWLQPEPAAEQDQQTNSKRHRCMRLSCRASFHLSLQEQQSHPEQWLGAKAHDAVFIRLQHSGGVVTSTVDASVAILQQQEPEEATSGQSSTTLLIEWCGSSTIVSSAHVTKVVCSQAIHARATQEHPCVQHCSCLLAAAPAQEAAAGKSDVEYVTLVTPHVCLDLFAQHTEEAVKGLARVAAGLHHQARCTAGTAASLRQAGAAVPAIINNGLQALPAWSPPAGGTQMAQWLSGAACEVNMMQQLLAEPRRGTVQQRHMLQALGHLHASLKP